MTMPAQNVEAAAGAGVLASEVLQDIWAPATTTCLATPRKLGPWPMASVVVSPDIQNCAKASPSSREIAFGDRVLHGSHVHGPQEGDTMTLAPFVIVLWMLFTVPAVHAQTGGKAAELEPQLRVLVAELDARWNARDADSMSRLFTPDVDFRIYGTRHHRSREEFRSHYAQSFPRVQPEVRHATTLNTVRLLGPGLALLDGEVVVGKPGAPEAETRRYYYTAVALQQNGAWLFDAFRVALQTKPAR
jgi:uncharacterized protein (TIGR02246 family)